MSTRTTLRSREIEYGTDVLTQEPAFFDLDSLVDNRVLIQANSGGGKSYLIRKLLEVTFGKVQHIVLDLEGEFATLRERYDYVLAGKGGDIAAEPKTAGLLAKKVLELNCSIIIDLYELQAQDRKRFVRFFLEAMINAPKTLWHPCLVVVDEAHVLCPEKGESEAAGPVIDLATRGRKRGYCAVIATQRIAKLHKDCSAELNNKLIGRTGQDIDMKRAYDELGFRTEEQYFSLRQLKPGEFFVFGPAFSNEVRKVKIGEVVTTHPKAGSRIQVATAPPPPEKVRRLLEQGLADVPKEAAEEETQIVVLSSKVIELQRENAVLRSSKDVLTPERRQGIQNQIDEAFQRGRQAGFLQQEQRMKILAEMALNFQRTLEQISTMSGKSATIEVPTVIEVPKAPEPIEPKWNKDGPQKRTPDPVQPTLDSGLLTGSTDEYWGKCERAILKFLAMRQGKDFSRAQVGAMTNYSPTSGPFNSCLSKLRGKQLINYTGGQMSINLDRIADVIAILGPDYNSPQRTSLETYLTKLGPCPQAIYRVLLDAPRGMVLSKERIGQLTEYSATSGPFNSSLSELCTLGLAERSDGGYQLNNELRDL